MGSAFSEDTEEDLPATKKGRPEVTVPPLPVMEETVLPWVDFPIIPPGPTLYFSARSRERKEVYELFSSHLAVAGCDKMLRDIGGLSLVEANNCIWEYKFPPVSEDSYDFVWAALSYKEWIIPSNNKGLVLLNGHLGDRPSNMKDTLAKLAELVFTREPLLMVHIPQAGPNQLIIEMDKKVEQGAQILRSRFVAHLVGMFSNDLGNKWALIQSYNRHSTTVLLDKGLSGCRISICPWVKHPHVVYVCTSATGPLDPTKIGDWVDSVTKLNPRFAKPIGHCLVTVPAKGLNSNILGLYFDQKDHTGAWTKTGDPTNFRAWIDKHNKGSCKKVVSAWPTVGIQSTYVHVLFQGIKALNVTIGEPKKEIPQTTPTTTNISGRGSRPYKRGGNSGRGRGGGQRGSLTAGSSSNTLNVGQTQNLHSGGPKINLHGGINPTANNQSIPTIGSVKERGGRGRGRGRGGNRGKQ
jgi:hypothetical protein